MSDSAISKDTNKNTLIGCLVVGIVFVTVRTGSRWISARRFGLEDGFCWLALVCQICLTAIYFSILNDIYIVDEEKADMAAEAMRTGVTPSGSTPRMVEHGEAMLRGLLPIQYFFWGCLWSVKLSLLLMFKRLTDRVPFHAKLWWGAMAFTSLAFIGCVISQLTSCDDIRYLTKLGKCSKPSDMRLQSISLYYSLAVDVLSDFIIMAIPVSLIWNLQINMVEKLGIGIAFSAGLATIIAAFLRAFLLDKSGKDKKAGTLVDVTWLCFWAAIECCIAVCVNSIPSFAILVRTKVHEHRSGGTYPQGYGQMGSKADTGMKSKQGITVKSDIMMSHLDGRYSDEQDTGAEEFKTRPDDGKYHASISAGSKNGPLHENSSQESIIGPEQRGKEVFVIRAGDIS